MLKELQEEGDIFGLSLYGDGATIAKTPFFNILAAGVHLPNACLEIHDCSQQMSRGGRKTAEYIVEPPSGWTPREPNDRSWVSLGRLPS